MGWRLSLVVVDDAATPAETYLERVLGGPLELGKDATLERALSEQPPIGGCVLGGRTVLFLGRPLRGLLLEDEPALARRLVEACAGHAVLAVDLNSTSNAWGWASWDASGQNVRTFVGDCEGVGVESGRPLATERRLESRYRRMADGRRQDEAGEVWSLDQLGEEYVFELVKTATGVDLHTDDLDSGVRTYTARFGGARFRLEIENEVTVPNQTRAHLRGAIECLRPEGPSFAILEAASGSYVQVGGAQAAMVVEGRLMKKRGFVHRSAGRPGKPGRKTHVPMSEGGVHAPGNEVLGVDDAARIFETFLGDETLDPAYVWRDRTAELS